MARVVAYLKTFLIESLNLVPRHVMFLVGEEVQSFGDEKRRFETILFQQRCYKSYVRLITVVERQDYNLVGDRLKPKRIVVNAIFHD